MNRLCSVESIAVLIILCAASSVLYIHKTLQQKKLFFSSFNFLSHFSSHPFSSPNELLQTAFQTILLSFFSLVSSSYTISFSYLNPLHYRYLLLFPNCCSATSFLFHLVVYLSPKRRTPSQNISGAANIPTKLLSPQLLQSVTLSIS